MQALDAIGQEFEGFVVTKYLPLNELQSSLIELVHEKTGARVIHIANDDPENLFALSFQTLPNSSNGAAHVLEHTVLCGSKKFPVKDPFFSMTRRSLNTYMNALTGQDFTVYPASSQVEKDFYNLLEVYLDAVFHPQLKHLSFLQEGHRFAFSKPGDPKSPLEIQGVVYNEMKGAMSSSDERLSVSIFKHLMPDLPYAYNSGGDPEEIPNLTYEDLLEFHHTFYHPSRCLFFFYGNLPLSKHLHFISQNALFGVDKEPLIAPLPPQPRFNAPRHVEEFYGIAPGEDVKNKTIVALGLLTTGISHQTDLLALNLIDSLLTDTDVSPLKFALLKSKLCTNVDSIFDTELSEAPWILVCKGCPENSAEKIAQLVRSTLKDLSVKGFDPADIEASLHQLEFDRTEIGSDNVPFGLTLFFRSILPKQHGAEPESALLIHSLFQDLKKHLQDPNFLTHQIQRFFLDNPHTVYLTMKPDPSLSQREKEEEEHKLAQIQSNFSPKDIEDVLHQEKELAMFQEEVEHQSIECLPKITLQDIPQHAKDYPLSCSKQGPLTLYHHSCFSNQIIYADLAFDLPAISWNDLPLLSFLTHLITEIGSGGRSYEETLQLQQLAVGELTAAIGLHVQHSDPSKCRPTFSLRAKALARNSEVMLNLLKDCSNSPGWQDAPRIKELLLQHATEMQDRLPNNAMSYAIQLATSGLSIPASLQHQMQGLPYLNFILDLVKSGSNIELQLERLANTILGTSNPSFILSCADEERDQLTPFLNDFGASLPNRALSAWKNTASLKPITAQGRIISSPVAFTALAFPTISFLDPDSPALMVATDLMENVVLHHEIREKGGAYGSGAVYSPALGHFLFYAFRDTQLGRTYQAMIKAIDLISIEKFTDQELFDAKLGIMQDLDAPLPPRNRAISAYGWLRADRSYAKRDAFRKSILEVSKKDVALAVQKHLAAQKDRGVFVTFAGKDLLKKQAKTLPFPIEILPIQ